MRKPRIPFNLIAEMSAKLPDAELTYRNYIKREGSRVVFIQFNMPAKVENSRTPAIGEHTELIFEANPSSATTFVWKLLTPVIIEG